MDAKSWSLGPSLKQAFLAGAAGTVVMTVFSFISKYISLPEFDLHGMLTGFFDRGAVFGWGVYFVLGVILAYLYGTFFRARLPLHSWQRGIVFALILWAGTEIVVMPVLGMGFFGGGFPAALAALIGIGLYGATVGYLTEH